MKQKIIFFIMLLVLMSVPVFSEQQTLGTFKQGNCIQLLQTCADCTYVNFTSVVYPNGSQILGNVLATQTGTEFTYPFCNTTLVGSYIVNGIGDSSGSDTVFAYDFLVTVSGTEPTNYQGIMFSALMLVPMFLAIILIIGGWTLDQEHNPLRIFLFLLSVVMFFVSLHIGTIGVQHIFNIPILEEMIGSTVYWSGMIFGAILCYFAIWMLYKIFGGFKRDLSYKNYERYR